MACMGQFSFQWELGIFGRWFFKVTQKLSIVFKVEFKKKPFKNDYNMILNGKYFKAQ